MQIASNFYVMEIECQNCIYLCCVLFQGLFCSKKNSVNSLHEIRVTIFIRKILKMLCQFQPKIIGTSKSGWEHNNDHWNKLVTFEKDSPFYFSVFNQAWLCFEEVVPSQHVRSVYRNLKLIYILNPTWHVLVVFS